LPAEAVGSIEALRRHARYFDRLARVTDLTVGSGLARPAACASVVVGRAEVFVPLAGMIDLDQERERLAREIEQKERFLTGVQKKLANPQFVTKAPAEVVERERQKERDATAELKRLRASLAELG
ncbi:MAG: valine--tRNA ligase, partial [Bacteroidetes bacterium]